MRLSVAHWTIHRSCNKVPQDDDSSDLVTFAPHPSDGVFVSGTHWQPFTVKSNQVG
jgi:hypothetical protein